MTKKESKVSQENKRKKAKGIFAILVVGLMIMFTSGCGGKTSVPSELDSSVVTSETETSKNDESSKIEQSSKKEESSKAQESSKKEEVPKQEDESQKTDNNVSTNFKETMDSYEAFIDEYVEFMNKYQESDDTAAMLADYSEFVSKYKDYATKIGEINEDELSAADLAYYIEVTGRVNSKLASIS